VKVVRTILLVDDSDDDEFLARRALKKAGIACTFIRLSDGQDAIDYFSCAGRFRDRAVDSDAQLVLLDINMPRVSGFEVLTWLSSHKIEPAPLVVIMLSSAQEERDRDLALRLGAQTYCAKPPGPALFAALAADHGVQWVKAQFVASP
jgi:DNA-binding response OmpR family regulator